MFKFLTILLISVSLQLSCRTTGKTNSDTWSSAENREATVAYIKKVVVEIFPKVDIADPGLQAFAEALEDSTSKQVESAQYLLQKYEEQRRVDPDNTNAEIASYVAEHFLVMTNYILIHYNVEKELKVTGLDDSFMNSVLR